MTAHWSWAHTLAVPCSGSTCELAHKTHTQSVGIHSHTHGHSLHRQLVHACLQLLSLPPGLQLHLRHQRAHQALHIIEVSLVRSGRYHTCFRNDSCHCSSTSVISARTKPSTSLISAWRQKCGGVYCLALMHAWLRVWLP